MKKSFFLVAMLCLFSSGANAGAPSKTIDKAGSHILKDKLKKVSPYSVNQRQIFINDNEVSCEGTVGHDIALASIENTIRADEPSRPFSIRFEAINLRTKVDKGNYLVMDIQPYVNRGIALYDTATFNYIQLLDDWDCGEKIDVRATWYPPVNESNHNFGPYRLCTGAVEIRDGVPPVSFEYSEDSVNNCVILEVNDD